MISAPIDHGCSTSPTAGCATAGCGAKPFADPKAVVSWFGAVQGQDYEPAKWSLASRCGDVLDADVDRLIDEGKILRTHALRPTWHFVAPEDIRWIQALTAPRVHVANNTAYRNFGIDELLRSRTQDMLERWLGEESELTRPEIARSSPGQGDRGRRTPSRPHPDERRVGGCHLQRELGGANSTHTPWWPGVHPRPSTARSRRGTRRADLALLQQPRACHDRRLPLVVEPHVDRHPARARSGGRSVVAPGGGRDDVLEHRPLPIHPLARPDRAVAPTTRRVRRGLPRQPIRRRSCRSPPGDARGQGLRHVADVHRRTDGR